MENAYQPSVRRRVVSTNGGNRISFMLLIDDHRKGGFGMHVTKIHYPPYSNLCRMIALHLGNAPDERHLFRNSLTNATCKAKEA